MALSAVFLLFFGTLDRLAYFATFNASFAITMLWGDKFTLKKGFNFFIFIFIIFSVVVLLILICDYLMDVINCDSGGY